MARFEQLMFLLFWIFPFAKRPADFNCHLLYNLHIVCFLPIQVLILLDTTPDESLLAEGVAREVVNRIQKLRKKVTSSQFFTSAGKTTFLRGFFQLSKG